MSRQELIACRLIAGPAAQVRVLIRRQLNLAERLSMAAAATAPP